MKAFFSRRVDRYRSAYGKANQDHPRQCVFIGTSNDLEFVNVTGNRRFWPFRIAGAIDVAAIVADRDQLWAEAMALYRQGVQWWLVPNIETIAAEQQAGFVEADIWEDLIADWLEGPSWTPFTLEQLFAKDTGITPYREACAVTRADQMRAARCLTKLGWRKRQKTIGASGPCGGSASDARCCSTRARLRPAVQYLDLITAIPARGGVAGQKAQRFQDGAIPAVPATPSPTQTSEMGKMLWSSGSPTKITKL